MVILQTPRLLLREWTLDDVETALPIYKDPEVMKFVFPFRPLSERRLRSDIERFINDYSTRGWGRWAIVLADKYEVIGHCGFDYLEHTQDVEFQIVLARNRWGQGFATEIGREAVRYGLEDLGFEQILAVAPPSNPRGASLAEKLGFNFVGEDFYYGVPMCCYLIEKK